MRRTVQLQCASENPTAWPPRSSCPGHQLAERALQTQPADVRSQGTPTAAVKARMRRDGDKPATAGVRARDWGPLPVVVGGRPRCARTPYLGNRSTRLTRGWIENSRAFPVPLRHRATRSG
jgi:hypothetical protein